MTPRRSGLAVALLVLAIPTVACTTSPATTDETPALSASDDPTSSPAASPSATPEPSPSEPSPTEEAEAEEERVAIGTADFAPATLTISAGTAVAFENEASFDHTVTEGTGGQAVDDPIVDAQVPAGSRVRVVFDEPGTYDITCTIHPSMQMTITVED